MPDAAPADPDVAQTAPPPVLATAAVSLAPGSRPHSHSKRRPAPGDGTGASQSVGRGLLVTPWFAAAAGFVIAASLWIISPHADLVTALPNPGTPLPGHTPAGGPKEAGQPAGRDKQSGQHKSAQAGRQPPGSSRARTGSKSRPAVRYFVLQAQDGRFHLVFLLSAGQASRHWTLTLELPGDQISNVIGAHAAVRQDGVTVGELPHDQAPGARFLHAENPGWHQAGGTSFSIYGTGTDVTPAGCRLSGAACRFQQQPAS